MTIASEIQRIKNNIADAYDAAEAKGATMPVTENSNNLADCINSISYSGEIENKNTNEGATNPLSIWQGAEQEYNQYEMTSWKNWKTDTNVSQTSTVTVPFYFTTNINNHGVKLLGGKHVVSDNGFIYYSDDGVNWDSHKIDAGYSDSYLLEYHNGIYYAFTAVSGTVTLYTSTDLINWTSEATDCTNSASWHDVCCVGGRFIGWNNTNGMVASNDGLHWANVTPPEGPYWADNRGISYVNGIGFYSRNMDNDYKKPIDLWTSTDGTTWTLANKTSGSAVAGSYKIAYGNGIYVMICTTYNGGYYANARTSVDGINWSDIHSLDYMVGDSNSTFNSSVCGIAFVNGRFLVAGIYNSSIKYSEDGENWQSASCETFGRIFGFLPVANNNTAIAYNRNLSSTSPLASPIILVDKKECYTLDSEPTTSSVIYSEPSVESLLTVTSVGVDSITLSDGYTYNRNTGSDVDTYRNVGEVHPDYLCFINNVGIKINNISIASA